MTEDGERKLCREHGEALGISPNSLFYRPSVCEVCLNPQGPPITSLTEGFNAANADAQEREKALALEDQPEPLEAKELENPMNYTNKCQKCGAWISLTCNVCPNCGSVFAHLRDEPWKVQPKGITGDIKERVAKYHRGLPEPPLSLEDALATAVQEEELIANTSHAPYRDRVYISTERNIEDAEALLKGMGLNAKAIIRLFDVIVTRDGMHFIIKAEGDELVVYTSKAGRAWIQEIQEMNTYE